MEVIKEEIALPSGGVVHGMGLLMSGDELVDFLTGEKLLEFLRQEGLVDIRSGKYTGEKQCIGPIPNKKTCQNKLTPCHNFNNDYCWNCIVNRMRELGKNKEADELAEKYL